MGHTGAQKAVLVDLLVNGDDLISHIAENTGLSRTAVYDARDELEPDGLIYAKSGGENRVYSLTSDGRRLAAEYYRAQLEDESDE